jgi:hypothetical protein
MNDHPCVFDYGDACQVLKVKKCRNCKFRKNIFEWDAGRIEAEKILIKKGLEPMVVSDGYHDVMSTKKIVDNDRLHFFTKTKEE